MFSLTMAHKATDAGIARPGEADSRGINRGGLNDRPRRPASHRPGQGILRYAGSRPGSTSGVNGPGSAMSARAASTWPHTFQRSTPRTRPSRR